MGAGRNRGGSRGEGEEEGRKKRREGEKERTKGERERFPVGAAASTGEGRQGRKKKRGREGGEQTGNREMGNEGEREQRRKREERGDGARCVWSAGRGRGVPGAREASGGAGRKMKALRASGGCCCGHLAEEGEVGRAPGRGLERVFPEMRKG